MSRAPAAPLIDAPDRIELDDGVVLRRYTDADLPQIAATVNAELEHLRPFMPWAGGPVTVESQAEWLHGVYQRQVQGTEVAYGMFRGEALLGACGLHARRGPGVVEIGYWLRADEQGKGLVTAAAAALTRYAASIPGVRRVEICCDRANIRSAAVPRRLGFTHVGDEERMMEAPGETGLHMVWSLEVEKESA